MKNYPVGKELTIREMHICSLSETVATASQRQIGTAWGYQHDNRF